MSQRRCPKCKTVYSDAARFCPKDGSMLVDVQGGTPMATPKTPAGGSASATSLRTPPLKPPPSLDRASTLSNQLLDAR